jgi:hypothetical protein
MTAVGELCKLAELRAKTDRDLTILLANAIELGIRFASAALGTAGPLRDRADAIHYKVLMLLPALEDEYERRRLTGKLERLRDYLDRSAPARAASSSAF